MFLVVVHWQHKYPSWMGAHSSVLEHLLFSIAGVLVQMSMKRVFICVLTSVQLIAKSAEFQLVQQDNTPKSRSVFLNITRCKSGVAQVISRVKMPPKLMPHKLPFLPLGVITEITKKLRFFRQKQCDGLRSQIIRMLWVLKLYFLKFLFQDSNLEKSKPIPYPRFNYFSSKCIFCFWRFRWSHANQYH